MSVHIANGLSISNYIALTASAIWRANNTSQELNLSSFDFYDPPDIHRETLLNIPALRALFACLYILIFVVGLFGNVLVCYVVFRNSAMHTVTNFFITNLALSDILLCMFAVPFTPLYTFIQEWIFGNLLCKLVPYAQGVSVYISAFTLMAIAVDRFFVIVYPFKARLPLLWCLWLIILMWIAAALLTLPYGIFMELNEATDNRWYCDEAWPSETSRLVFGLSTSILQFVMPFIIITFCYVRVCARLRLRVRTLPGTKPARKEERTRRTNRMLITMVAIFGISWLPLNGYNVLVDMYVPATAWRSLNLLFFLSHAAAMSSTCYNPFLYAWLNDNFRQEFNTLLPCLRFGSSRRGRVVAATSDVALLPPRPDKTCNGQETILLDALCPKNSHCHLAPSKSIQENNGVQTEVI